MKTSTQETWIHIGYQEFAHLGMSGLKVEQLAQKVGISKSSFYHHFADMEVFVTYLLEYHLQQSRIIGEKERNAACIDPDLIDILIAHKTDLLFNRQLRIHQNNKNFNIILQQSNALVGTSFVMLWVKELNLQLNQHQLAGIFALALENFFLQINEENIHAEWLRNYFSTIQRIAHRFH